ncbi:MAG: Uma2 family endonuclease [Planctomycetia bacterium]|nr:Uma2 family endonuclease [Planctomycetia bacterium]
MDTQNLAEAVLDPLAIPTERLHRITLDVYHKMTEYGLLTKDDKVELLDGLIVTKPHDVDSADPADRMFRFSLDFYHRMAEHGLLSEHARVVLLDGLLVKKMTRGAPHVRATIKVFRHLSAVVPGGWEVRKEDPVTLPTAAGDRDSEPEPDVFVVRGSLDDYTDHHPGPADLALVVEVAASSLREDRAALTLYAWAGIPVAWIVNLLDDTVEVHSRQTGPADPSKYEGVKVYQKDDHVPVTVDGREVGRVAVRDLLP